MKKMGAFHLFPTAESLFGGEEAPFRGIVNLAAIFQQAKKILEAKRSLEAKKILEAKRSLVLEA